MSDINEALQFTVSETREEKIRDLSYTLNLLSNGEAAITTEKINGFLEAIHIQSEQPVNVSIGFMNHSLLQLNSFQGMKHFLIRQQPTNMEGRGLSFGVEKIALNDAVDIKLNGMPNTSVTIIFRYC